MTRVIVIGAGIGGLTTAAVLAKAGLDVTVLEAHIYPGGCAGTFFHKGYRFDAGATVAGGFYPDGPMDLVAQAAGITAWPVQPDEPTMVVHLPDGTAIPRWSDDRRWHALRDSLGAESLPFWRWQESTADSLWDFALRIPPWPPQNLPEAASLVRKGTAWLLTQKLNSLPHLARDAFRTAASHIPDDSERLRSFVDAQLLISAQATSQNVYGLYAASALDLPRRGVVHARRGIGALAETIVAAIRQHGGEVRYRSEVKHIIQQPDGTYTLTLKRGDPLTADILICNLPPWNITSLFGDQPPPKLKHLPPTFSDGWGAFTLYIGLDDSHLDPDFPLHHQVICREPMGEGNTVFLSLSPAWDDTRAPAGHRALTMSTHTRFQDWWHLHDHDPAAYETRKAEYTERMLVAAEVALPNLRAATRLLLPGTPVTFHHYTRRRWGWVGGFPQTNLFRMWGSQLDRGLWMVGDSIFPGQSIPAVAMGGLRVAEAVLHQTR